VISPLPGMSRNSAADNAMSEGIIFCIVLVGYIDRRVIQIYHSSSNIYVEYPSRPYTFEIFTTVSATATVGDDSCSAVWVPQNFVSLKP